MLLLYTICQIKRCNKTDSYIYILPTKNSTVFFKTQKDERVEALEKRENFVKVLGVDSDFIGWVKEESFEKIRGLIVFIQFSISVAIVVFFMYLFRNHTHKVIKIWMKIQMFFLGIKLEIEGNLDESCDLILINHQSMLDIIVMEHLHSRNIVWVAKKRDNRSLLFGHIIKAPRMISIDRENKAGLIHLLSEAKIDYQKVVQLQCFQKEQEVMELILESLKLVQKWLVTNST